MAAHITKGGFVAENFTRKKTPNRNKYPLKLFRYKSSPVRRIAVIHSLTK
jgi:hypothetical protein